jgi:hypothetical protein
MALHRDEHKLDNQTEQPITICLLSGLLEIKQQPKHREEIQLTC